MRIILREWFAGFLPHSYVSGGTAGALQRQAPERWRRILTNQWSPRYMSLPESLKIPWLQKPLNSAETNTTVLPDGRIKLWIRHEPLSGVTPAMLVWWFQNLEGDLRIGEESVPRYRAWHPLDHISIRYVRRSADGSVGPGTVLHIQEAFSRNPAWLVDTYSEIEKLDESGYIHCPLKAGIKVARMEYTFEKTELGTQYTNWIIAGLTWPLIGPTFLNPLIRSQLFPADKAQAWLTHNVEEVGNFQSFLPELYRAEACVS